MRSSNGAHTSTERKDKEGVNPSLAIFPRTEVSLAGIEPFRIPQSLDEFCSSSRQMKSLLSDLKKIAGHQPILLFGETGTGKGVLAKLIHASSERRSKPFKLLNCGAMDGDLLG